jgi:hypothetical protein
MPRLPGPPGAVITLSRNGRGLENLRAAFILSYFVWNISFVMFFRFIFFHVSTLIRANKVVKNYWQIIKSFLQVAQSLDEMPINFGNSLLDKRGHFYKANCYSHSRILQWQKRKVQNFKVDSNNIQDGAKFDYYGLVMSNSRSILSSFHNSSVEFSRRKVRVVAHTLVWVTTYITILQICNEIPICTTNMIINDSA